ncbi:MAG: DMT family transporter [Lachnospiraceae bacterium]|nr:DMT family transporter [Lachnospiraceae bacterium]
MKLKYSFLLVLTALIWGLAFVAQSKSGDYMSAYTFTAVRFLIASICMFPVIYANDKRTGKKKPEGKELSRLWLSGVICGILLYLASLLQQMGITLGTSAGKAGFLTAMYIIIVPIISHFLFKNPIGINIWLGVLISLVGLYMLCMGDYEAFAPSDLLVLACAFVFSLQILSVDHYSKSCDVIRMSTIEFFACGVTGAVVMIFTDIIPHGVETWAKTLSDPNALIPLLYAAIFSSCVGYTLQNIAQKKVEPTLASLLFSLESVFAAVFGWLILKQGLSTKELWGCVLVFAAIIIAQLPKKQR